ncbi:hypothetical protein, partial [Rhizobium ruizarguesonis]
RAYLCHRHLLFKGWLKQPNPSNQKRIMQIPHSKCRASGFVQSLFRFRLKQSRSSASPTVDIGSATKPAS